MLHQWFQETQSQFWDPNPRKRSSDDFGRSYGKLPYQLWSVSKYGTCADAAITGIMPPPLMEIQVELPCLFSYSDAFFSIHLDRISSVEFTSDLKDKKMSNSGDILYRNLFP